jgi:hypothetical protein
MELLFTLLLETFDDSRLESETELVLARDDVEFELLLELV